MNSVETKQRDQWGSKIGFILAAAGSAIGLGNIWKFPYLAGQNGGGAFVFVYFGILFLVGFTLMLAELVVGRSAQLSPVSAYKKLNSKFGWIGGVGVLAAFIILSYYSIIGGWVIKYTVSFITGAFNGLQPSQFGEAFTGFITSSAQPIVFHAIFMIISVGIVIGGISAGIEKYSKILMPALFIILVAVMIRVLTLPGAVEGLKYLFIPDFSKINSTVMLKALGQVFFSLSLGMGAIITYGSYLSKDENLVVSAFQIPLLDTMAALMAAMIVIPAVFAYNLDLSQGPGLLFVTMSTIFSQMPLGSVFGFLFFVLVLFAAVTSSISLLEVSVSYFVDEKKWDRKKASIVLGIALFLVGIPSSLGLGAWSHIRLIKGLDILDSMSFITDNLLMPIGGFMLCIFIGWIWGLDKAYDEATNGGKIAFGLKHVWGFLVKYIAPLAIGYIFISGLIG